MNCLVCGESIAEHDKVCPVCGTVIASLANTSASEQMTNLGHTATSVVNLVPQPEKMGNQKNLMPSAEENIHAFLHKLEIQSGSGEGEENIYALVKSLITQPSLDLQAENLWLSPAQRTIYAFFKLLVDQATWLPQSELLNLWQQIHPNLGTPDLISDTILDWCEKNSLKRHLIDIRKTLPGGELNRTKGEGQEHNFRKIPDSEALHKEMFESALIGTTYSTSSTQEEISIPSENILDTPRNNLVNQKVEISNVRGGGDFPPDIPVTKVSDAGDKVIRYTDISCPRQVWVKTPRISVVVRLTVKPSEVSDAPVNSLLISKELPVIVRVDAPGFEVLSNPVQKMFIESAADSVPVVFDLKPRPEVGYTRIDFDFFQAGIPIGNTSTQVEITAYEATTDIKPNQGLYLDSPLNGQASDLILYIRYEQSQNAKSLNFTLFRNGNFEDFYSTLLPGNIETYANSLYNKLTNFLIDRDTSARLSTRDNQMQNMSLKDVDMRLKKIGYKLWKELIPLDLKKDYLDNRENWYGKTLMIVSDEPYIPWELVWPYDKNNKWKEEAPWCISMRLTRWLYHDEQGNSHAVAPTQLHLNKLACIVPKTSGLPCAREERKFFNQLVSQHQLTDNSPKSCYLSNICELLEKGEYSWLHIASHGDFAVDLPDDASAIMLENGEKLTLDDVLGPEIEGHIKKTRPGFVFNACHSGRQAWALTGLGGWPNRLIGAGAGLFLAPLWRVSDDLALEFAKKFYQELLQGKTVAEAVLSSRLAIRSLREGDSTWLAYSVYAHPNAMVTTYSV